MMSKDINKQQAVDLSTDTIPMLASRNQLCRELVKPHLNKRYQGLCNKPDTEQSQWLLGNDLSEIKNTSQSGRLGQGAGRWWSQV